MQKMMLYIVVFILLIPFISMASNNQKESSNLNTTARLVNYDSKKLQHKAERAQERLKEAGKADLSDSDSENTEESSCTKCCTLVLNCPATSAVCCLPCGGPGLTYYLGALWCNSHLNPCSVGCWKTWQEKCNQNKQSNDTQQSPSVKKMDNERQ